MTFLKEKEIFNIKKSICLEKKKFLIKKIKNKKK